MNIFEIELSWLTFFSREEKPLWGKVGLRFHSTKVAREKRKLPVKKIKFLPVKIIFCPWKNHKKPWNCPWKKKSWPWKILKKGKKVPVKKQNCPWKNRQNGQKWFSRAIFFFTGKKKTLAHWDGVVYTLYRLNISCAIEDGNMLYITQTTM